jgi:8-oxo-dGTP pyrophosphatase MutT (NUDIX family)
MIRKVQVVVYRRAPVCAVLLLRRGPDKGRLWQPVTGKIEAVDPTPRAAAERELEEETGIGRVRRLVETGREFRFAKSSSQVVEHLFGAEVDRAAPVALSPEHVAYAWLSPEQAMERLTYPIHREGLRIVLEDADAFSPRTPSGPPDGRSTP